MAARRYTRLLWILLTVALFPATAQGFPQVHLTGPSTGSCVGTDTPIQGTLSVTAWDANSYMTRVVQRADTGEVVWDGGRQSNDPRTAGGLDTFDTRHLPTDVDLLLTVQVVEPDGTAADTLSARWNFDRAAPTAPQAEKVLAASGNQVLVQYGTSADLGCSGGIRAEGAEASGIGLGTTDDFRTDSSGILNGASHDTLSPPVLTLCHDYVFRATATDRVGLSTTGSGIPFKTACSPSVVVVGQLNIAGSTVNRAKYVLVTASAPGHATVSGMSDASGIYQVALDPGASYTLSYSTGCPLRFYCDPVQAATDSVQTGPAAAAIVLHNRTLVAG